MPFITHSRKGHQVFMFDVGHGDCVLIIDDYNRGLVVDCGAQKPRSYLRVPQIIENLSVEKNNYGLLVSHYHWDHYSLFRHFSQPNSLFSKIYIPDLPIVGPGMEASRAVMCFLMTSVLSDFSHYRALPEVFSKSKRPVVFCKKGDNIREAGLHLSILWPDLRHPFLGSDRIKKAARIVRETVEPVLSRNDIPVPSEYGEDYSMETFFTNLEEIRNNKVAEEEERIIHHTLRQVERQFRNLADVFSIVFRTYRSIRSKFLFLGDAPDNLLDQMRIPGYKSYHFLKASHHGTRFGKALRNMVTEFVLISRNRKEFPGISDISEKYIMDIQYDMLLSTELLGDCYIY